jgi:hypothetical protein
MNNNIIGLGDSEHLLKELPAESVHLIFTSPPYFNARPEYSQYDDYQTYLDKMHQQFLQIPDEFSLVFPVGGNFSLSVFCLITDNGRPFALAAIISLNFKTTSSMGWYQITTVFCKFLTGIFRFRRNRRKQNSILSTLMSFF